MIHNYTFAIDKDIKIRLSCNLLYKLFLRSCFLTSDAISMHASYWLYNYNVD